MKKNLYRLVESSVPIKFIIWMKFLELIKEGITIIRGEGQITQLLFYAMIASSRNLKKVFQKVLKTNYRTFVSMRSPGQSFFFATVEHQREGILP